VLKGQTNLRPESLRVGSLDFSLLGGVLVSVPKLDVQQLDLLDHDHDRPAGGS
jgi:hypothetical protein